MLINLKVKTLDARTHEFSIDNELTIRQFKDQIAEKTNIAAENQRIIYQGRVLADDKQVKEYDVDGKVLHVAERPPFSQRGANYRNNDEPMRTFRNVSRPTPGAMRTQPYFRALDGMLVGTMAIPVNNHSPAAGARTTPPNRFPNSSSFCINRITVALHMIDCVNNIAAYLENPAVGLNNQSLDILQRGRWSMESTVVEVGVSSTDLPRNNNIIDMVQDAVNAALSRGTNGRNYTVVQLPTVYTNESGETTQQRGSEIDGEGGLGALVGAGSDSSGETTAAAVIIEDVIETDDEAADGASDRSTTPTPDGTDAADAIEGAFGGELTGTSSLTALDTNASGSASAGAAASTSAAGSPAADMNVSGIGPRRRTRPQVLANVIQNYRNVQNRLAPFVQRYYEILEQDPVFEESDTAGRESAQRIFDRVSEAFHYLSHAQHAISDLMLDLSQSGPRVLTCRPILVEQSGYIRSNNIFAPNLVPSPLAELIPNRNPNGGGLTSAQQLLGTLSEPTPPSTSAIVAVPPSAASTVTASTASNPFQDAAVRANVEAAAATFAQAALSNNGGTGEPTRSDNIFSQHLAAALTNEVMNTITNVSTMAQAGAHSNNESRDALTRATVDRVRAADRRLLNDNVEDPVDEPMVAPSNVSGSASTTQSPQQPQQPPRPEMDPQVQMARLIQAVVNSSTNDGDVRVEFNSPNIMSINLPVHVMTAAVRPASAGALATGASPTATATTTAGASPAPPNDIQSRTAARIGELFANVLPAPNANAASTTASTNASGAGASAGASSTSTGRDQRAANTLPTTATQTRSTSRPQIQLGGNNNWGGRIAPTHTAFDRFLPCNSHHIREPELLAQHNNNNNNNNNNRSTTNAATAQPPPLSSSLSTPGTGVGIAGIPVMATTSQPLTGPIFAAAAAAAAATGAPGHRGDLRAQVRTFLYGSLFRGETINEQTIPRAITRALNWFDDSLIYLPQYERPEYNSRLSVYNIVDQSLRLVFELCSGGGPYTSQGGLEAAQFEQRFKHICDQFRKRLYSVLFLCLGSTNAELYWRQLMRLLCVPLRSNFHNEALQFLCIYIDPTIPSQPDTVDAQQFLVLRSGIPPSALQTDQQHPLDTDIEMIDIGASSSNTDTEPPLPSVTVGAEPWHINFPSEWLPAITRDLQTQNEQNRSQPPYSDAYICGMSAKRRKVIQAEKPTPTVECFIASGVQRAMHGAGVISGNASASSSSSISPDAVIDAIANDAGVHATYTEALRTSTRERIKQDVDYSPSKYPQIAKFTEQK
ncbi:LOW QUALITY PROTEIN: large proline-rich protein bag6 [Drosophila tropicalis]|uniref:LOW QUALITY PROTEIN: large proline-rich protein bag6 n=1 Tax=Drosophila tropicalis TaxID=46794 RepID=UPI0035AC0AB6